ncbi:MAG: GIY-YIG nuclease family protein [Sphingobacteriales bacterium]|nr:MAG: GIY-YIG nuclease family protein [Sphingobacteriales bacterium]
MAKKLTIDDIFDDDDFGLLDSKAKAPTIKSDNDRLIDSFEEINAFYDKNKREPNKSSMSEYGLMAKLKNFRENEARKKVLKPFDRHNLLGYVEMEKQTIDDILNDDDLGLLYADKDLDIFKFKHTPRPADRAEADFVAQRKPLKEKEFEKYEAMFQKVHKEIKEGKSKILEFKDVEKHLLEGQFYVLDGLLLFLEKVRWNREQENLKESTLSRKDGRTRTIFENATLSNMWYRSLGKSLYNNGKMITNTYDNIQQDLFVNTGLVKEEDIPSGWIYVLKTKSTNSQIANIKDLYKVGFASNSVDDRIKNAKHEATYLFAEVQKVATYKVYNRNAYKLESLLHRFFANACLDIDLFNEKGQRLNPREWFVVPFEVIEETIQLILNENIVNYEYNHLIKNIKLK